MIPELDTLRGISIVAVLFKVILSAVIGGAIGIEREKQGRPAGFRTHMLVSLGATMAMILGLYEDSLLQNDMASQIIESGAKVDISRFGAQVINGIGFLGAGTILVNQRREIKGLTTAAGLWASGCLGIAIGSGFFECAIGGYIFILFSATVFKGLENRLNNHIKMMSIYAEFDGLSDVFEIASMLRSKNILIRDMDFFSRDGKKRDTISSAIFLLVLPEKISHNEVLEEISDLMCIRRAEEV